MHIDMRNIRAVIFDMDGVITNTMPYHFQAWKTILKKEGISATYFDIYCREGQQGFQSVKELFVQYKKPINPRKTLKLLKDKERLFKRIVKLKYIPGARRYLHKLVRKGIPVGLVTGTSRHEAQRMLPIKLWNIFSVIVTGSDVKHGKPHPEPYRNAVKTLKVKNKEIFVVENAPFGITSAKRAGLYCVALETSLPRRYLVRADRVFSSFNALSRKLKFF